MKTVKELFTDEFVEFSAPRQFTIEISKLIIFTDFYNLFLFLFDLKQLQRY